MTDEVKADPERLERMAAQLRESTSAVDQPARSVPEMPEVTTSGEPVSYTISELMRTIGALAAGAQETADKIDASGGSYGQVDNRNADDLGRDTRSPQWGR